MDKDRPTVIRVAVVLAMGLGILGVLTGCLGVLSGTAESALWGVWEFFANRYYSDVDERHASFAANTHQTLMMIGATANGVASVLLVVGASLLPALQRQAVVGFAIIVVVCAVVDVANSGLAMFLPSMHEALSLALHQMAPDEPAVAGPVRVIFVSSTLLVKLAIYALSLWAARLVFKLDVPAPAVGS